MSERHLEDFQSGEHEPDEQRKRQTWETEQLMQPDTYERTRRSNGRLKHY